MKKALLIVLASASIGLTIGVRSCPPPLAHASDNCPPFFSDEYENFYSMHATSTQIEADVQPILSPEKQLDPLFSTTSSSTVSQGELP